MATLPLPEHEVRERILHFMSTLRTADLLMLTEVITQVEKNRTRMRVLAARSTQRYAHHMLVEDDQEQLNNDSLSQQMALHCINKASQRSSHE